MALAAVTLAAVTLAAVALASELSPTAIVIIVAAVAGAD